MDRLQVVLFRRSCKLCNNCARLKERECNSNTPISVQPVIYALSDILRLLQDDLDHLVPQLSCLGKPGLKIFLNLLKLLAITVEIAQTDTRAPVSGGKGKFEIVSAERVVVNGRLDGFFEKGGIAEEVLCYAEPHSRGLSMCQQGNS